MNSLSQNNNFFSLISDYAYKNKAFLFITFITPPLAWLGIVYLGSLLILLIGCSNFEFVYNISDNAVYKLKNRTLLSISGENKDIINNYMFNKIGEAKNGHDYILSIVSSSSVEAAVIESDATALKFMTILKEDIFTYSHQKTILLKIMVYLIFLN